EELLHNLQDKYADLLKAGHTEEKAYEITIDSIGEISELIESMNEKARELQQLIQMDFSKSNLKKSDFTSITMHDGKFDYSNLQGSDFSFSDLTNCSFKYSNLDEAIFHGVNLTNIRVTRSNLNGASFR